MLDKLFLGVQVLFFLVVVGLGGGSWLGSPTGAGSSAMESYTSRVVHYDAETWHYNAQELFGEILDESRSNYVFFENIALLPLQQLLLQTSGMVTMREVFSHVGGLLQVPERSIGGLIDVSYRREGDEGELYELHSGLFDMLGVVELLL